MPPLLAEALIAAAPAIFGGTLFGSVSVGLAAAYGITTVAAIGAQFAFSRIQANRNKKQKGDLQITQMMIKQPIPVRTMAFGRTKLGGAVFYDDAFPVLFQPLILGIAHCEGPIHRFIQLVLNDSNTAVSGAAGADASGINASLPWAFYILLDSKRGTATQTASTILTTQRGLTDFTLKGIAYSVMMCTQPARPDKNFQYYYPNGVPTLNAIIEGSYVYDPRDGSQTWATESTWKYSQNSALIILWFLTYYKIDSSGKKVARGMNIPRSMINLDSFIAFANMCDQTYQSLYTLNPFDGSAARIPRNEPRYECGGSYNLNEAPADVLNKLLATCDGTLYTDNNGLVCIRGGSYETPTVLINDDMILSVELSAGGGVYELFNRVKISFNAENMGWQVIEGHPWDDTASIDDSGVLAEDLTLEYVHSYSQARRLAKIAMAKGNPEWVYSRMLCTFAAANVLGEEFVHVTHTLPGIDQPFLVHSVKLMPEQGLVELSLSSIDPACYDWNPSTDDAIPPTPQGGTG
jgi:hypothetical protein